ncbi:MAG: adenylosuccinate lyase [Candidatus Manganitrophus sp.]|nr:MAG: adenylosuccinate lyase [Candidatus Manganitrophus sp.]
MIERYSRPQMAAIWESKNKYETWLKVELLACEAMVAQGEVPKSALKTIRAKAEIDPDRIDELEKTVKHDVIAFLSSITEKVGEEGRYLHMGMTSSDVLDTCLAVQLSRAADILLADLDRLLVVLERRAGEHKNDACIGRSHGIHAEPTTFGVKLATFHAEFARAKRKRLEAARADVATCAISGAVGTFAQIDPRIEAAVAKRLGLSPEPVSTQVIPRDRHAMFFATLAVVAGSIERLATEIRHLQRTEVLEAEEFFSEKQKGSSAMPHKRNPIGCENICGLARVIRSHAHAALENVPLWHERDISHSSVERIILPDSTILLDFMLTRFTKIMKGLFVYPERMTRNLDLTGGTIYSQKVLLLLIQKGMKREKAYEIVQSAAMAVFNKGGSFKKAILSHPDLSKRLSAKEIEACFDPRQFVSHIETIYKRVFNEA